MLTVTAEETAKLKAYLSKKFGNPDITLRLRENAKDSVECLIRGEFIGLVYKDEDEGEVSYTFTMAILDMDLAEAA